ncbi:MAG: Sir2 family NAD-dependent protein deacetylase [Deltaproteobacteria bacterium]|nr:Sir2 family NAD-dependent protein deacetylase [Deltaproteobacteria bacterium]
MTERGIPVADEAPEARLAALLAGARHALAFTGAGISTESGIPDFRSPGGVWAKYQPVLYDEFLSSDEARRRYWRMKREGYRELRDARPNAGHRALARLEAAGRLRAVITQNIDGLHQDAGSRRVLELHGTSRACVCLGCGVRHDPDAVQALLDGGVEVPRCAACGGLLKSATISFGQPLPVAVLAEAVELCDASDLVLALGSSLVVEPAASLPLRARQRGARLVIVNHTPTPLDRVADLALRESIGAVLTRVLGHLGLELPADPSAGS